MLGSSKKNLLLFLLLAFAFAYRVMLMLWAVYPPGADIGLHDSVIHSIMPSGNADFLWNNYQMGGGLSLTFPGFHIFVSQVIILAGIPDYLAQTLVVALFSTLIVACAFLVTRKMWSESAGFIVAFLVAVSRFDIEMLMWAGYPNVITSMLIPLIVYIFLQSKRFSLWTFLATSSLLCASLFITHSLSSLVFDGIVLVVVIFALILSKKLEVSKKRVLLFLAPVFLGTIIALPYLIDAIPAYLANAQNTSGVADMRLALLSTKIIPWELLAPLAVCVVLFFLYSKEYKGKFLTVSSVILTLWILVPVAFTQGYFVGFYTDFNRFLYYPLFPVFILIAVAIDHGASFLSKVADVYVNATKQAWQKNVAGLRVLPHLSLKRFYAIIALVFVLFAFFSFDFFITPWQGNGVRGFYQVMTPAGYEGMQWAKQNTPADAVFVSDALYGWWLGGFAQRPTFSAVDPQYLTLAREFAPAQAAKNLLDTDYVLDNGLIQVREDGGYSARHNPMFSANINWSYFPYTFFNFKNDQTTVFLTQGGVGQLFDLSQLDLIDMNVEKGSDWAAIHVSKGNQLFNYTQIVTVYKYVQFVNMSVTLETNVEDVTLYEVDFTLQTKGLPVVRSQTVAFYDEGAKVLGQLIFTKEQPSFDEGGPQFQYTFGGGKKIDIELWASAFSVSSSFGTFEDPRIGDVMMDKLANYQSLQMENPDASSEVYVFDYSQAVKDWNVSYIAVREIELIPKFAADPAFNLLFINEEVAIFQVK
jgi:hypothetical protein